VRLKPTLGGNKIDEKVFSDEHNKTSSFQEVKMSEEYGSYQSKSLSWSETWIKALTQPSEASYAEIANDPEATPRRAYTWIFISSLIGYIIYMFVSSLLGTNMIGERVLGSLVAAVLCGAPIGGLLAVLGIMINAGISQLIASALGGTGTYSKLVYAVAAYTAPLSLISFFLGIIPYVNCLALPLGLYGIFLNITAVKAVNRFSWGKAVISSIVILVLLIVLVAIVVIVVLALLGPAIGNVFSDVLTEIGTPIP
jgi:pilus assembly protein Flp/PilA